MEREMSPGPTFISLITLWVLDTYDSMRSVEASSLKSLSPRRLGSGGYGLYGRYAGVKSCSFAVLSMPRVKKSQQTIFESTPSQTQQPWAERPARPLFTSHPYYYTPPPALIPATGPFHRSAHRYCAWNPTFFPSSTPSGCFPSEGLEAIELIKGLAEPQVVESSTFRNLNCFETHREAQHQKAGPQRVPGRDFAPGRGVLIHRSVGWGPRNCVNSLEREGFRRRGLPPSLFPSPTYACREGVAIGGLDLGWGVTHSLPFPPATRRSLFCPSRARGRPVGDS
jgi:hypothetical protein